MFILCHIFVVVAFNFMFFFSPLLYIYLFVLFAVVIGSSLGEVVSYSLFMIYSVVVVCVVLVQVSR